MEVAMRRRLLHVVVALAVLFTFMGLHSSPTAQAQPQGFLTFENGVEGGIIGDIIPGVRFSTVEGFNWFYADMRTRLYNGPYPDDCSDRPQEIASPQCAYAVNGNFVAFMGALQGTGRIDFTNGNGTFFEAGFSTRVQLTIEAFNAANELVSSATVVPNINTGRLDRARVTGANIAYILISGNANSWWMDDLATDAPGVPDQTGPAPEVTRHPAEIYVVQRPKANYATTAGSIIELELVVGNLGRGDAKDVIVSLPFDPAAVVVLDATFTSPSAWVSNLGENVITIRTGSMGSNSSITGTVRLQVRNVPAGTSLASQLNFTWDDYARGGNGRSNMSILRVAERVDHRDTYVLLAEPTAAGAGNRFVFASDIFAPNEPVGVWYNLPDGQNVRAGGTFRTNADGNLVVYFDTPTDLSAGTYSMVFYGHWTEFTAVAPFTVTP